MRGDDDPDDFFQFDGAAEATPAPSSHDEGQAAPRPVPPRLGLLANLTEGEFDRVARAAKLTMLEPGHVVFEQGDAGDRFFILVDGELDVVRDGAPVATLGPGAFFGETALLLGTRRTATVATRTACALWSVDYGVFEDIVSRHLLADETARREVEARLGETGLGPG